MLSNTQLQELVRKCIVILLKKDADLLIRDVKEESISFRLAHYLEIELCRLQPDNRDGLTVDCEYNKHHDADKILHDIRSKYPKKHTDIIRPDIILHKRGNDLENSLIVEIKKGKGKDKRYARDKIKAFVNSSYGYQVGAYIEFVTGEKFRGTLCVDDGPKWIKIAQDNSQGQSYFEFVDKRGKKLGIVEFYNATETHAP
jgi:hypothetical protein